MAGNSIQAFIARWTTRFTPAKKEDVRQILETLVVMGQARKAGENRRYVG